MRFTVEQIQNVFKGISLGKAYSFAQSQGFEGLPRAVARLPFEVSLEESAEQRLNTVELLPDKPVVADMTLGGLRLPVPPMISLGLSKNIVQTPVAGRDFTVKEIISAEDYRINLKGVVINTEAEEGLVAEGLPMDFLLELNTLMRRNESLTVACELLNDLDIFQVVVQDFKPVFEGLHNAFAYEVNLLSDTIFELELSE